MSSEVYFLRFDRQTKDIIEKVQLMLKVGKFDEQISEGDLVAIKVHLGERGSMRHPRPQIIRAIVDFVKSCGGKPFITDTTTLYRGYRTNAVDYLETAAINGFNLGTVNAPIIIADGLKGRDYKEVEVGGRLGKVAVASAIAEADCMIVVSHVKFHVSFGFGGALKNLAMGCVARKTKCAIHSPAKPIIDEEKCIGCGICTKHCLWDAIKVVNGKAKIDYDKCVGCGDCLTYCPRGAPKITWDRSDDLLRRAAEACLGVIKTFEPRKIYYINTLIEITRFCDCGKFLESPLIPDIGILASYDPVAIDKASIDLINNAPGYVYENGKYKPLNEGEDKVKIIWPEIKWEVLLEEAEKLGIGKRSYKLIYVK